MAGKRERKEILETSESINNRLWRGQIEVGELRDILDKFPPDAFVRLYSNKINVLNPSNSKMYSLDQVVD